MPVDLVSGDCFNLQALLNKSQSEDQFTPQPPPTRQTSYNSKNRPRSRAKAFRLTSRGRSRLCSVRSYRMHRTQFSPLPSSFTSCNGNSVRGIQNSQMEKCKNPFVQSRDFSFMKYHLNCCCILVCACSTIDLSQSASHPLKSRDSMTVRSLN